MGWQLLIESMLHLNLITLIEFKYNNHFENALKQHSSYNYLTYQRLLPLVDYWLGLHCGDALWLLMWSELNA